MSLLTRMFGGSQAVKSSQTTQTTQTTQSSQQEQSVQPEQSEQSVQPEQSVQHAQSEQPEHYIYPSPPEPVPLTRQSAYYVQPQRATIYEMQPDGFWLMKDFINNPYGGIYACRYNPDLGIDTILYASPSETYFGFKKRCLSTLPVAKGCWDVNTNHEWKKTAMDFGPLTANINYKNSYKIEMQKTGESLGEFEFRITNTINKFVYPVKIETSDDSTSYDYFEDVEEVGTTRDQVETTRDQVGTTKDTVSARDTTDTDNVEHVGPNTDITDWFDEWTKPASPPKPTTLKYNYDAWKNYRRVHTPAVPVVTISDVMTELNTLGAKVDSAVDSINEAKETIMMTVSSMAENDSSGILAMLSQIIETQKKQSDEIRNINSRLDAINLMELLDT